MNEHIPGLRWIPESSLHVTVQFIGDVDPGTVEQLSSAAARVSMPVFPARLTGVGAFPDVRRPRVIWVGIEEERRFKELRKHLRSAIEDLNLGLEIRPFTPHLSVGRIRRGTNMDIRPWLSKYADYASPTFEIDSFHLFSSELRPEGANYRKLKTYPFHRKSAPQPSSEIEPPD